MPEGRGSLCEKLPGPQSCLYWEARSEHGSVELLDLKHVFNLELDIFPVWDSGRGKAECGVTGWVLFCSSSAIKPTRGRVGAPCGRAPCSGGTRQHPPCGSASVPAPGRGLGLLYGRGMAAGVLFSQQGLLPLVWYMPLIDLLLIIKAMQFIMGRTCGVVGDSRVLWEWGWGFKTS